MEAASPNPYGRDIADSPTLWFLFPQGHAQNDFLAQASLVGITAVIPLGGNGQTNSNTALACLVFSVSLPRSSKLGVLCFRLTLEYFWDYCVIPFGGEFKSTQIRHWRALYFLFRFLVEASFTRAKQKIPLAGHLSCFVELVGLLALSLGTDIVKKRHNRVLLLLFLSFAQAKLGSASKQQKPLAGLFHYIVELVGFEPTSGDGIRSAFYMLVGKLIVGKWQASRLPTIALCLKYCCGLQANGPQSPGEDEGSGSGFHQARTPGTYGNCVI